MTMTMTTMTTAQRPGGHENPRHLLTAPIATPATPAAQHDEPLHLRQENERLRRELQQATIQQQQQQQQRVLPAAQAAAADCAGCSSLRQQPDEFREI